MEHNGKEEEEEKKWPAVQAKHATRMEEEEGEEEEGVMRGTVLEKSGCSQWSTAMEYSCKRCQQSRKQQQQRT